MFHSFLHRGCTGLVWPLIGLKCLRYSRGCTGFMFAFDLYTVVMLILIFMLSFIYVLYRFMCVHVYIYIHIRTHMLSSSQFSRTWTFSIQGLRVLKILTTWSHDHGHTQPYCRVRSFCPLLRVCKPCHLPRPPPQEPFYRVLMVLNCGHVGYISG